MLFLKELYEDARNIKDKDPASKNILEVIILYPGFHILIFHRIAHFLYSHKLLFLARFISQIGRFLQELKYIQEQKLEEDYLLTMEWEL